MQTLDISQINILAPYPVWYEGEEILFKTDYNILYSVAFELDDMLGLTAYWFRITNRSGKKYVIKTAVVYDEGIPNHVSLIVPIEHPLLEDIQATFESEIIMFQNNK